MAGIRNLIVFGRAVTNVLQNLRSTEPGFDVWYETYRAQMKADPLMKHFYDVRSRILKHGDLPVHSSLSLSGNPGAAMRYAGPPPAGAKGFFIGDSIGGSGWEVQLPDGSLEKFYVALPTVMPGLEVEVQLHLSEAPGGLRDQPVQKLGETYLEYLANMVSDAAARFGDRSPAAS